MSQPEPLGLILVRANKITRSQLYEALREQRSTGSRLGDILFKRGWIGEEELAMLIAKQLNIPYVNSAQLDKVTPGLIAKFPAKVASDFRVVPIAFWKGKVTVAMDDQKTRNYFDEISYLTGMTCVPAMASPGAIRVAVKRLYGIDIPPPPPPPPVIPRATKRTVAGQQQEKLLEALPVTKVDAQGRNVVEAKNAAGQDVVYLLTEVAAPSPPAPEPEPPEDVPFLPPIGEPEDTDGHDNFLAPEAADAKPAWRPKGDRPSTPVPAPKPVPPPPVVLAPVAKPTPAGTRPAVQFDPELDPDSQTASPDFDIVRSAERLFEATDARGVGAVIVGFARHLVDRAILFDVGTQRYTVLARSGMAEDDRATEFTANAEDLLLLGVIAQTKQPAYGPTPGGEMYDKFFDHVGFLKPPVILLYPLVVAGRTRAVLFGGLGRMRNPEEFGDLQLLFKEAATALEILAG